MYALCNTYDTCGWVWWLGIKVSISGERVVGGYNAQWDLRVQRPSPPPPSPPSNSPSLPLRMFWSRICIVLPSFHKMNSDPGLFQHTHSTWERLHLYLHPNIDHHLGLWDVAFVCSLPQKASLPLSHVSLRQDLLDEKMPNRNCVTAPPTLPPHPLNPRCGCLKPDSYMLFGQKMLL